MAIYKTAYDTTLGQAFQTQKIIYGLKQLLAHDGGNATSFDGLNVISSVKYSPYELYAMSAPAVEIPHFSHPVAVESFHDRNYLFLDSRLFKKYNDKTAETNIVNRSEYDFSLQRYFMNFAWLNIPVSQIKTSLSFGGMVYANWISEIVSRKFALDPRDQLILSVITHFFYQQLFLNEYALDERTKQLFAIQASKATNVPVKLALELVDKITIMTNVEDYCANVVAILDNIRLKEFSAGFLFNLVGMSWYGNNAKENIAIGLEHIPTWLSICFSSMTNKTYKHSTIANVSLKYSKGGLGTEFAKNFESITKSFLLDGNDSKYSRSSLMEEIVSLESVTF